MEKLSEDNWVDIFNLLSSEDIENAADSCENWRNIITTTPSLMQKLTLRIDFNNVEETPWMKLPYQNLYLKQDYEDTQRHKIDKFIQDIDQLTAVKKIFIGCLYLVDVLQIVNNFSNITTLVIQRISAWGMQDDTKIDLPNLAHLKIDYGAFLLLPKIRSHKVEVFCACEVDWTQDDEKSFGSFLQTCDKLKHLSLQRFYTDEILKIKSQLETFEFISFNGTLPSSFLQFLKSQKSSLKNLTLNVEDFNDEIANYMYFEMNLDKIVDCRYCGYRGQIQKLKKVSVKNLTINSKDNFEYFEKLFQCCEMLEVLDVGLPGRKQLEFLRLLSNLPKLKFLKLSSGFSTEELQPTFKFNRLERLNFYWGFIDDQCVKIIRCCPNLTHVKMNDINLTKNEFEKISEVCNKIQEIYLLLWDQEFTDEDVETYKDVGSKIKLKIETDNKNVIEKLSDTKNLLTVIPFERPNFDPFVFPRF